MEVKFEMYAEKDPINVLVLFDLVKELCASGPILSQVDVGGVSKSVMLVDAEIIKIIDPVTNIDMYQIVGIGYIAEEYKKDSGPYIMGIDLARGEDEVGYFGEYLTDIEYRSGQKREED